MQRLGAGYAKFRTTTSSVGSFADDRPNDYASRAGRRKGAGATRAYRKQQFRSPRRSRVVDRRGRTRLLRSGSSHRTRRACTAIRCEELVEYHAAAELVALRRPHRPRRVGRDDDEDGSARNRHDSSERARGACEQLWTLRAVGGDGEAGVPAVRDKCLRGLADVGEHRVALTRDAGGVPRRKPSVGDVEVPATRGGDVERDGRRCARIDEPDCERPVVRSERGPEHLHVVP